jgi:predicted transposase/invertase (TIGR01784 family)
MKIPIVKIIDFKLKKELREKLETSTNPMTMVVKAQLKSHEVKKSDAERKFAAAKEFIRQCYKNGYSRDDTRTIMKFFDWVIRFPEALKNRLKEEIKKVEEEYKMEYVPLWERDARQEGWEEGVEIGVEKGVEKKAKETARKMLKKGFDIDIIIEITGLSKDEIEKMTSKSN